MEKKKNPSFCFILKLPKHRIRAIFTSQIYWSLKIDHNIHAPLYDHDIRLHEGSIDYEYSQAKNLVSAKDLLFITVDLDFLNTQESLPNFETVTNFLKLPYTIPILVFPESIIDEHKAWMEEFLSTLEMETEVILLPIDKELAADIIAARYKN